MSPFELELLLNVHYSPIWSDFNLKKFNTPAGKNVRERLEKLDLIMPAPAGNSINPTCYKLTPKGAFYINYILNLPLPVSTFFIPEEPKPA